jgi:hypothetical protein
MAARTYIVSVDAVADGRVAAVAEQLRQAGFEVTQQLETIGVIIGAADDGLVSQLRDLPGVAAIEEEQTFEILSPETDKD